MRQKLKRYYPVKTEYGSIKKQCIRNTNISKYFYKTTKLSNEKNQINFY